MAEEKKKEEASTWDFDLTETIILLIIFISIASTFIPAIISYIASGKVTFYGIEIGKIFLFFKENVNIFRALGIGLGGVAATAAFAFKSMADSIEEAEIAKLFPHEMESGTTPVKNPMQEKWEKILALSDSQNPSDWRLAIIEADIVLDDLLESLRLPGNTMGDKLKAVEPSDFITLDNAWEAHKARNMIAHQGSDYLLNQRETKRIVSLYETVFKEFELI